MSGQELREAAALMRERAMAARDVTGASDWHLSLRGLTHSADYSVRSSGGSVAGDMAEEEAEHIASWHPAVALKVAAALDSTAAILDESHEGPLDMVMRAIAEPLVELARTYLGGDQ